MVFEGAADQLGSTEHDETASEDVSSIQDALDGLSTELLQGDPRPVEKLSPHKVNLPIDRNGVQYDFVISRGNPEIAPKSKCRVTIYKRHGRSGEREKVPRGDPRTRPDRNEQGEPVVYPEHTYYYDGGRGTHSFDELLHSFISQYVSEEAADKTAGKRAQAFALLQEIDEEELPQEGAPPAHDERAAPSADAAAPEQVEFIKRGVRETGPLRVLIPYDHPEQQAKFDIICQRVDEQTVYITAKKHSYSTGEVVTKEFPKRTFTIGAEQDFRDMLGRQLDRYIGQLAAGKRQAIPEKAQEAYDRLFSSTADQVIEQANYVDYKTGRYTFSIVKEYLGQLQSLPEHQFSFHDIDQDDQIWVLMNAVIDYNKGVSSQRLPKESDGIFLPKLPEQVALIQDYINQVSELTKEKISPPAKSDKLESEETYGTALVQQTDYLLRHGRNGFLDVGARAKNKKLNYNAMKRDYLDKRIGDKKRFAYVKEQFKQTSLPPVVKQLGPCIPMQESSYINTPGRLNEAAGLWQLMPRTAEEMGLTVDAEYDQRLDLVASTRVVIRYLESLHSQLAGSEEVQQVIDKYGLSGNQKKTFLALTTLNAYNSGQQHMIHACDIILTDADAQQSVQKYIAKHGKLGVFLYITNEYPRHWQRYQKEDFSTYYKRHSPEYVYNILKYYQIANKEGDIAMSD